MCKTNPISPVDQGPRRAKCAKRTQFRSVGRLDAGAGCANKPNSWRLPIGRSAFPGALQGEMRKTNPIFGGQDTPPFPYSTIPAFPPHAFYAKRSQSATVCRPHPTSAFSSYCSPPVRSVN